MRRYIIASSAAIVVLLLLICFVNLQNGAPAPAPGAHAVEGIAKPDKHIIIKAPAKLEVEGPDGVVVDPWAVAGPVLFGDAVRGCYCYFYCGLPGVTNQGVTTGSDGVTLWCVFQPSAASGSSGGVMAYVYYGNAITGTTTARVTEISWSGLDASAPYVYRLVAPLWYNYTDTAQAIEVRQHVLPPFISYSSTSQMTPTADMNSNPGPWTITIYDYLGNQITAFSGSVSVAVVNQTHLRIRVSIAFSGEAVPQRIIVTRAWRNMWSQPYIALDVTFKSLFMVSNGYVMVIDKYIIIEQPAVG